MKILHLCLSCFYIDGYAYQENVLISEHLKLGHDVKVIASTEVYSDAKVLTYTQPGKYVGAEGADVTRLPYRFWPNLLARKIRSYPGLTSLLREYSPDLIFFHGLSAFCLVDVALYVRSHPECRLILDCHEDFNNSARFFVSRNFLHRLIYRPVFKIALAFVEKIYAITVESVDFAVSFYGAPKELVELLPLGGYIPAPGQLEIWRNEFRQELGFDDSQVVIAQTGKLDATKQLKCTLLAFAGNPDTSLRLVIAGKMTNDVEAECSKLIREDKRVHYLGWQTPDMLIRTLAGADFFLQPFGQTATTQQAMCLRCAVLLQDVPSHRWLFCNNGLLFKDSTDLPSVFDWIGRSRLQIPAMRKASFDFSTANLDYRVIAKHCIAQRVK